MISFEQRTDKKVKAKSVIACYLSGKTFFIFPIIGAGLVALYIFLEAKQVKLPMHSVFFLVFGALLLLKPFIDMMNNFLDIIGPKKTPKGQPRGEQKAKSNPQEENPIVAVEFDEENIKTSKGDSSENFRLDRLYGYRITREFIFLFSTKTQYFVIDKRQIDSEKIAYIEGILRSSVTKK